MASLTPQQLPQPAPTRTETATPSTAQQTQTQPQAILRLRGARAPSSRKVKWREDVIDNEGLNKKKSKVCCIYHRPRDVDESSDESSSSDSSDSDSDSDGARKGHDADGTRRGHDCDGHHHHYSHGRARDSGGHQRRKRQPSPNAYEKMPRYKPKKDETGGNGGNGQGGPTQKI
ncbi:phosphatase inhibitor-domain-containing protein [Chaetomium strumarium]|uniref:Type 1 phosphatases regulator n=1 Tax=Chaetomium strumarium TaxID=1170767 RepID=A0AAJ0GR17_9PEZI|nr:phosphatase inhibitor-domain-containing protein [Chaetomium strumarium]